MIRPRRPRTERLGPVVALEVTPSTVRAARAWAGIEGPGPTPHHVLHGYLDAVAAGTARRPAPDPEPWESARFLSTCWCEAGTVEVTPEETKAGSTRSCGREACHGPA